MGAGNRGGKPTIIELPHLDDPQSPEKTGADDYARLNPRLKDEALSEALLGYAAELAAFTELYRLNAQYVIDESAARIVRLYDADGRPADRRNENWKRADFSGLIETETVERENSKGEKVAVPLTKLWCGWGARNRVVGRVYQPKAQTVKDFVYVYDENGRRFLNDFMGWGSVPQSNHAIVAEYWTALLDALFHQQSAETKEQTDCAPARDDGLSNGGPTRYSTPAQK